MTFRQLLHSFAYIWLKFRVYILKYSKKPQENSIKSLQNSGKIKNKADNLTWDDIYDIYT